jgi:hypothetical protein
MNCAPGPVGLVAAVHRELREFGAAGTVDGHQALVLANRIENPGNDTGSSMAAVSRELGRVMRDVRATYRQQGTSLLDELAELRRIRRAPAGAVPAP